MWSDTDASTKDSAEIETALFQLIAVLPSHIWVAQRVKDNANKENKDKRIRFMLKKSKVIGKRIVSIFRHNKSITSEIVYPQIKSPKFVTFASNLGIENFNTYR